MYATQIISLYGTGSHIPKATKLFNCFHVSIQSCWVPIREKDCNAHITLYLFDYIFLKLLQIYEQFSCDIEMTSTISFGNIVVVALCFGSPFNDVIYT